MKAAPAAKALAVTALALLFVAAILQVDWPEGDMDEISNEEVAETLFGTSNETGYGFVLLLIGLLLLVAMLGGVFLAKEEKE